MDRNARRNSLLVALLWSATAGVWVALFVLRLVLSDFIGGAAGAVLLILTALAAGFCLFCSFIWWRRFFKGAKAPDSGKKKNDRRKK